MPRIVEPHYGLEHLIYICSSNQVNERCLIINQKVHSSDAHILTSLEYRWADGQHFDELR